MRLAGPFFVPAKRVQWQVPTANDVRLRDALVRASLARSGGIDQYSKGADTRRIEGLPGGERYFFERRGTEVWAFPADMVEEPSHCLFEGCELDSERGSHLCAFYEMFDDANDLIPAERKLPRAEDGDGILRWDGYGYEGSYVRFLSTIIAPKNNPRERIRLRRPMIVRPPAIVVPIPIDGGALPVYGRMLFAPRGAGGMFAGPKTRDKLAAAFQSIRSGSSMREAQRLSGCAWGTVKKLQRFMRIHVESQGLIFAPRCQCGQPSGHKGWCRYRFMKSPMRQAALRRAWQQPVAAVSTQRIGP